ncbi:MAG TPA: hypothetical protein VF177_16705 [Anaerolineae bacterium]
MKKLSRLRSQGFHAFVNASSNGFAVITALIYVIFFLRHAGGVLVFPYEMTNGEGLVLRDAANIRQGLPVYTDPGSTPYIVSIYTPLFPAAAALASFATGVNLAATRSVAILSTVLCAIVIGAIIYRSTRAVTPSLAGGLAFLGSLFVYQWAVFGRVDTLALLLSLISVAIILHCGRGACVVLAALFCLLAFYTKQTAVASTMAISLFLFLRSRRLALTFVGVFATLTFLTFVILNSASRGQFYLHTFAYNVLPYSLNTAAGYLRALVLLYPFVVAAGLGYLVYALRPQREVPLPAIYAVAAGMTALTAGRTGSSINHLLELVAALMILGGIAWAESRRRVGLVTGSLLPLLLVAQLLWPGVFERTVLARYYQPSPVFGYTPGAADFQACRELDRFVAESEGPTLAEDVAIAIRHGREPIGNAWVLNVLHRGPLEKGYSQLKSDIESRRFALVLLHWQTFPQDLLYTVVAHYEKRADVRCIYEWQVFVPRQERG